MKPLYILINITMLSLLSIAASAHPQNFYTLESALKQPSDVKVLELKNKGIKALPASLEQLKNIEVLDLSDNQLTEIPAAVFKMVNLKKLILLGNDIQRIPDRIGTLVNMEEFRISGSYTSISAGRSAPVAKLPDALLKLPKLKVIEASYFGLAEIPASIYASHIQKLYLNNNNITSVPAVLFSSKTIKVIDLSNNAIAAMPASIEFCPTLEVLRINGNQIAELPASIANLKNLKDLNKLKKINIQIIMKILNITQMMMKK